MFNAFDSRKSAKKSQIKIPSYVQDSMIKISKVNAAQSSASGLGSGDNPCIQLRKDKSVTEAAGSDSDAPTTNLFDQLHHDLKADEDDLLFLQRRILFPGIFVQESDSEEEAAPAAPKRVIRPACRIPSVAPIVVKEEARASHAQEAHHLHQKKAGELDDISCGSGSLSGLSGDSFHDKMKVKHSMIGLKTKTVRKTGDGAGVEILDEEHYDYSQIFFGLQNHCDEAGGFVRMKKPQDENLCEPEPEVVEIVQIDKHPAAKLEIKQFDEDEYTDHGSMISDSILSLTEKLCILEEKSKKPLTLKERYVGNRKIPGYPGCQDKTTGYPECLPAGEIVRRAIDTMKLWGIPEGVPLAREQFISLMKNLENHDNNDYVCLVFALPFSHPEFNPYFFRIVKYHQVGNRIHYTMSRYGALYIANGLAEYTSMFQFHSQMRIYDQIRTIPLFYRYRQWKAFWIWRSKIRVAKMQVHTNSLVSHLFIAKKPLRHMLIEFSKMCERMATHSFLKINYGSTYDLLEFTQYQMKHLKDMSDRFRAFETKVIEMTGAACRTTLLEEGFTPDFYEAEMEYYLKQLEIPVQELPKKSSVAEPEDYPGQWLSFSHQRQKRQVCKRLSDFIRLIDYLVQKTYHKLLKSSMFMLLLEMHSRLDFVPEAYYLPFRDDDKFKVLCDKVERYLGMPELSHLQNPMFDIGCSWNDEDLVFSPSIVDYVKAFRGVFGCWRQVALSYKNMLSIPAFHPYTQPIINGYVDQSNQGMGPSFEMFLDLDKQLDQLTKMTELILKHGFHISYKYIKAFNAIRIFCLENQRLDLDIIRNETDVRKFEKWLLKFREQNEVLKEVEDIKNMGVFRVNNSILRAHADPTIIRCLTVLREVIPVIGAESVTKCKVRMTNSMGRLEEFPHTADEYVAYLLHMDDLAEEMDDIEAEVDTCAELFDLMEEYNIPPREDDTQRFHELSPLLVNLRTMINQQFEARDRLIEELLEQFRIETEEIFEHMKEVQAAIDSMHVLDPKSIKQSTEMAAKLTELKDILLRDQDKAAKFNSYQKKLKLEVTNFDELDKLIIFAKYRHQLWDSITRWDLQKKEWDNTPFHHLDYEQMTREVNEYVKSIQQLEKGLPPNDVVPILKEKVGDTRAQLPWIANFHNPNIRQRHWDIMEKTMGMKLTDDDITLKQLIDAGIANYADFIQEISAQASSEFSLEALLKKVEDSWMDVEFIVLHHKDQRDVFILGGTDDIQVLLDDSLIHMTTISSSRHVGPIKPKVDEWVKLLDLFSTTIDEWLNCQRNWIHLESVFSAPDIQRQLPDEARMFAQVDKSWREIMSKTNRNPAALRAATQPGLLETLTMNNELLDQIMKCLDDYLESKRVVFPRFYFLSNEELLEILAQTRNPQAVQPHLRKCFDAVQKLEFGGPPSVVALDILAIFSPEDERVVLTKGLKTRGNVEDWLGKVEDAMFNSLKRIMRNCLTDWHSMDREEWIQKFPSQCVLTISQLMWAQIVHMILDGPGNSLLGMKEFEKKNFENLNKLAAMVRGQLAPLVRAVLCAQITIDVHGRDIITSLVNKKVEASSNFEWLKQLRYYWNSQEEVVVAKMANAQYFYGYEYLGASPRLVITPLTDRCYLCLMGALQLDLGGAPAGPAGTGKTETTKDLAKSLAFMCVVFNCSEGLDYKMMGRFFSGLAQSGGWCCFDEFNRIDIEVLSVIAQQLITIRLAKVQRALRFMFEGREIKLIRTCAAFITMNPGYAGRTELPDNLKSLFRPISMMVPDYTLIAEVILYSEGFESSKSLANKMTQMYKLCSEQLSQQDHYDFGMRAVKSVLVMAGSLKRSNPDINENVVLIRALRDSNLPKFLAHDAILLHGIIQDLFPGVVIPEQDYGLLEKEARRCALEKGLQVPECFIRKVIQFYETLVVRHGVMLVGPTGGGKTAIYEVLKSALTALFMQRVDNPYYKPVDAYILNPKAVSLGELYGEINNLTLEWHDGLLGIMVRNAVRPKLNHHQWIICDGPVDAVWIENMNTVLDDNKMLCLANSERIKLTNWVRMMFEVQDLAQASPATVSRCGMVYVDPNEMGWRPYVQSWAQRTLGNSQDEVKSYLMSLFNKYVDEGFAFVKKNCHEIMPQSVMGKMSMMCSILQAILKKQAFEYDMEKSKLLQQTCQVFLFAYIWSIGGNIHDKYHQPFDQFVRVQFEGEENCKLPKSGLLWGYYNNLENKKMDAWETIMPSYVYNATIPFVDVLVPTVDTVRFGFLMELLLSVNRAVLFTGPTGTGKSAIAKYVLTTISGPNNYLPIFMNFSAQTTSKRTQEMIEEKLEKRKKTLLSAPMGKKVIVFIDDVNMPKLDRYGAQPSLELLRQLLDFNGCYDRVKLYWRELQNVILSAACAPPGGGRNAVTPRLLRHFCMMAIPTPTQNVLTNIYRAILRGFLHEFDQEVRDMGDIIVSAAISTYQFMASTFLPTPSKAHYLFNMRDLSKCIQGILQGNKGVVVRKINMIKLYFHECLRVFHDRLTTDDDRHLFCNSLAEICSVTFKETPDVDEYRGMIFGDFMKIGVPRDDRVYDEIVNKEKLKHVLSDYLDEYNVESSKELNLVFFTDAAEQVARIARILRTDRGNALLVGVGGTGKQSLTKLSSHISGYRCFQIELMRGYDYNSFHDDLKKLYEVAGMKNEPIVFLFTDTQIAYEEFLEDINNILNSGEVPNLLEPEDQERMLSAVRADAKKLGISETDRDLVYDYFIRRIRSNLHIVLCMSPVGDSFRVRCRMFPSLVNCCTINWFSEWPTEALLSVAVTLMSKIQLGKGVSPEAMADVSVFVHESVTDMAVRYYEEMRRRFYTTPSSYLELINLYSTMLNEQRDKILQGKARIQNGLSKLLETNEIVKVMRVELKDLEPILVQKSQAVEDLMVRLAEDQAAADIVRKNVQVEEATAKEKAMETQAIAEDAQKDLAEALPALEAAVKSLDQLNKDDINEIRAFQKPPELVRTVMESVCVLFGVKPDWDASRKLLSDSAFLKKLYDFEKDNVSEKTLKNLKVYMDNPKFNSKAVEKVSKACKSICLWVRAIDGYAKVFKTVEPKRNRYLGAQAELDQVMETLKKKQGQLNDVEMKIAALQEQFQSVIREKTYLEDNMELTSARLSRAARLTKALASEQTRWAESIKKFDEEMKNIIGDVFIGAACIAYFGVFTSDYRKELVEQWSARCMELGLPCTPGYNLISLADPFEVRVWNANGLPRDNTSTENAVLATRGRRWPLMIDPQDQANRWIRQNEEERNLKVLKLTDGNFMRTLENCIRLGYPCLLEEVKEHLEPALEPVLLRQIFTQNGRTMIRLGDSNVDYDKNFRLYMTTKMANPHYLPEVCIKVTIINFTVTMSGLEDQLLSDVVSIERPDLESQRAALVSQINSDKNQLISLESKILKLLFQSEGNILDDEELIDALNDSKETSTVIVKRVAQAEITEKNISTAREKYRPVASRGSVLYFVVAQLAELDPMYQYSLKYFSMVFNSCIGSIEKTEELEERLKVLRRETTLATYTNISRGLFEKDKLIFSFMLCCDILKSTNGIADEEWNFFLRGAAGMEGMRTKKPATNSITTQQWESICDLENYFPLFEGFSQSALKEGMKFKIGNFKLQLFMRKGQKPTDKWDKKLSKFQKLLMIKSLAQEKLIAAVTEFVQSELGQKFIESPAADLGEIYKDLNKTTSLIFVLSVGSDPMAGFYRFANDLEMHERVAAISLGQGQGPIAEGMIKHALDTGDWVFLQNCHLASSWLPRLETLVKYISENPDEVNESFRLFLSSMPSMTFPVSILQESVKITNEPPKGLRANVRRALVDMEKDFFEANMLGSDWRRIIFGICFFHAVIQERKKFGPLGWNIKYEFNDSDRECCLLNLDMFCKNGIIPWDALEYITGQITYGGRITDNWDQRCLTTILKIFFSPETLNLEHKYSPSGLYYAPNFQGVSQYVEYVDRLPIIDEPEIFGMHSNATITFQRQESTAFLNSLLSAQPKQAGGSAATASDEIALDLASDLEEKLPDKLDHDKSSEVLFALDARGRTASLTIFIQQEIDRFNKLLSVIRDTLAQLKKGIRGLVVMSEDLEKMYRSFLNNQVPDLWKPASYGSLKSLASWFKDFQLRFEFIRGWQTQPRPPSSFWLSGFFFQQGFLTAVLQTYARKYNLPIDQLRFHYRVLPIVKEQAAQLDPAVEKKLNVPEDGVLIHGLYMEAARWDMTEMTLEDSLPGEMNPLLPVMHFQPSLDPQPGFGIYTAPLYKTSVRQGILSTTGHSTNFIVPIQIPSLTRDEDYWILKGTALLSQLTD